MGLSGWNAHQKLKLIIDSSKVDEDLINFPVNITLSSGTGQTGFDVTALFDELITVSGTKKIAITTTVSGIETELYVEIERWDWANEEANLWVKVPTVSSGTGTELFLYYDSDHADNTTYIGDTGDSAAQSVWDSSFVGVWHMSQDPNGDVADAIKDSTSSANHGTPDGSMTSADLVDGKIGKGIDFDSGDDYIDIPLTLQLGLPSLEASFEFIAKGTGPVISTDRTSDNTGDADIYVDSFGRIRYRIDNQADSPYTESITSTATSTLTEFNYYALSTNITSNNYLLVVNSTVEGIYKSFLTGDQAYDDLFIARHHNHIYSDTYYPGDLDEIRISDISRSAVWLKATYYSNWNDFVTFSEAVGFVFTNPIPAHLSTAYGTTKQLYLTTTISGPALEYTYDADFYDSFDVQIGTTVSGINSGNQAASNAYLSTPSGIDCSWYMTATSSGAEDTSQIYTFHNRFLASGTTEVNGVLTSGIDVRLYLRDTGELLGSTVSTTSGVFNIETQYNAEFYCIALSPYTDTNSLMYDFLEVD